MQIQSLSHTPIYVANQEQARQFYVDKLGFEVRSDLNMGGFRWLTVAPKAQEKPELILMPLVASPMMEAATVTAFRDLQAKGALGCGVLETDDCQKLYEALKKKGVTFRSPPAQRPYGLEAILVDDSGNWFSLVQRPS